MLRLLIMSSLILIVAINIAVMPVFARQSPLSDDQQLLLDDILKAYERADVVESYSLSGEDSTTLAVTLTSDESIAWRTADSQLEISADYYPPEQKSTGQMAYSYYATDSETAPEEKEAALEFIVQDEGIQIREDESNDFETLADNVVDYADFNLTFYTGPPFSDIEFLLETTTAVYDLGVQESGDFTLQVYELDVDVLRAFDFLHHDLDALISGFHLPADEAAVSQAILDNGTATLRVSVDMETGFPLSEMLSIEVSTEIPAEATILLEYAVEHRVIYYNIGVLSSD